MGSAMESGGCWGAGGGKKRAEAVFGEEGSDFLVVERAAVVLVDAAKEVLDRGDTHLTRDSVGWIRAPSRARLVTIL